MNIAIIGTGSWGTALTILLARQGHEVTLIGRDKKFIESLEVTYENTQYLPGFMIPRDVFFRTLDQVNSFGDSIDCWVIAVPSQAVRKTLALLPLYKNFVVMASKGLEGETGHALSSVVNEYWPEASVGVLSGPNLAVELVCGVPSAAVMAGDTLDIAEQMSTIFRSSTYRVYTSKDRIGVELVGALKNVLAIAGGMSDGLGFGDNTKGTLLARGLHEVICLGLAMGAQLETFVGVAGVGDLFATANSRLSRNYRVGYALGQGKDLQEILNDLGQVAEGISTSKSALILAQQYGVSMPITETVAGAIEGPVELRAVVSQLMERSPKSEGFYEPSFCTQKWQKM